MRPGHSGFTLVELLVAVTLTTLLCLLVADVTARSVATVSTACGKMTATEKLDRLHQQLGSDLAAVPWTTDRVLLQASEAGEKWRLTLQLPARNLGWDEGASASSWRTVTYEWEGATGNINRHDSAFGAVVEPGPFLTGVQELEIRWLTGAGGMDEGVGVWQEPGLPSAARIRMKVSGVWEERVNNEIQAAHEKGRDFSLLLPVGEG